MSYLNKGIYVDDVLLCDCHELLATSSKNHKGLFCFNRLPFGIASAPAIFQRRIESILQGLPGVQAYLDDVLIAEEGDSQDRNLMAAL